MRSHLLVALSLLSLLFILSPAIATTQSPEGVVEEPGRGPEPVATDSTEEESAPAVASVAGTPAYDSGWMSLPTDSIRVLTHHLGGNPADYVVDMQYRSRDSNGINLRYYGGADFGAQPAPGHADNDRVGAYWRSLNASTITVYRRPEDSYAEQVRIRIWVMPVADYDSNWLSLTPGAAATTLNHGLGGDADDYVLYMEYREGGSINQRYFGGNDFGATAFDGTRNDDRVALYWRSLDNASITLFRRAEDNYADDVRVRIWVRPTPTYDSGWVNINPDQSLQLSHAIGGDVDDYVVDMQFREGGSNGVNQRGFGGMDVGANPSAGQSENDRVGAYWRSLSDSTITIYRRPEDTYAEQMRIRIWHTWEPVAPAYDSGWTALGADSATVLAHNLGGDANEYLVDMLYRMPDSNGVNLRYFGGADFGSNPAPGHSEDDRVATYWRSLDSNTITLFRRAEDDYAPEVRIRIWRMPLPDYDSGWFAQGAGAAATVLQHGMRGDIAGYLVDLQYQSAGSGINQRYYGGADFGNNPAPGTSADDRVGAYWRSLTGDSIALYRRPDDIYAEQLRVRIWRVATPAYDSQWVDLTPDSAQTLAHEVQGAAENYLVQMLQDANDGANDVNQRHFGGADFGSSPPSGYAENDRVGAYWRSLGRSTITVYERPEDGFADRVRVQIWDYSDEVHLPIVARP